MKRLPLIAFGVLAGATVLALFLVQHLKNEAPLVWDNPTPIPAVFDPRSGRVCIAKNGNKLDYRHTTLTFSLSKAETVDVYVTNAAGAQVATISSGRNMPATKLHRGPFTTFTWKGHENGGALAPDGLYYFEIVLPSQNRIVDSKQTAVQVLTTPPRPRITGLTYAPETTTTSTGAATTAGTTNTGTTSTPTSTTTTTTAAGSASGGPLVLTPLQGAVRIHFTPAEYRRAWIEVYRTDLPGAPKLINRFRISDPQTGSVEWNGETGKGLPAPAGTYLIRIEAQNMACIRGSYPVFVPPSPGTTPGLGVTVRYLAATPPLTPTAAGSSATVQVSSPTGAFTWALRQAGHGKVLETGGGESGDSSLQVPLPVGKAGLYRLTLTTGAYTTSVPLVAYAPGARGQRARVLVVLPMLTWQGENRVDDTGDGLPTTLAAGQAIRLDRPFANGLPASYDQDVALLKYLDSQHFRYQLTTDVAFSENVGPTLVDRWGVVLAGPETWLPRGLAANLQEFVRGGGRILSLGTGALSGTSAISGYPADPVAAAPVTSRRDIFGATHGPVLSTGGEIVTELTDQLGIFGLVPAFSGYKSFEPIEPPAGVETSLAGIADGAPAVSAFKYGRGYVMEVGLTGFTASLTTDLDSQELLSRFWQLLAK